MIYHSLAKYYDQLLGDPIGSELWIQIVKEHVSGNLLELACGSGYISSQLALSNTVLATDLSVDMIREAMCKYTMPSLTFRVMDMLHFEVTTCFDGILCFCDSVNYLTSLNQFKTLIKNAYQHLKPKGIFMFDMHHKQRLYEFEEEFYEEGYLEDVGYIFTIVSDIEEKTLHEHFTFFVDGNTLHEDHVQYVFEIEDIKNIMEDCGFKVKVIEDFVFNEKVMMIGEKV
ncbi:MAG: class I SAM-dependent methyltransferase [Erysipelotrichaceae bacterium]|nr:class I SAM-dependent methyltransferase [Erysipelotrichaceae bacterium]